MASKETILLGERDKAIEDFLEKARVANGLRVQIGSEIFLVSVNRETVSQAGRDFLTKNYTPSAE